MDRARTHRLYALLCSAIGSVAPRWCEWREREEPCEPNTRAQPCARLPLHQSNPPPPPTPPPSRLVVTPTPTLTLTFVGIPSHRRRSVGRFIIPLHFSQYHEM
ncbi:hypothetical protein FRB91_001178 [Serendipita sp. 411]|nr:hypothetical protein FRB91_001178 [Serendipita sp. 411]